MGNAPLPSSEDGKLHRARGGRVEVNLMKNSLNSVASASADSVPASGGISGAAAPAQTSSPITSGGSVASPQSVKPANPPL
jgi:hypothetical protein